MWFTIFLYLGSLYINNTLWSQTNQIFILFNYWSEKCKFKYTCDISIEISNNENIKISRQQNFFLMYYVLVLYITPKTVSFKFPLKREIPVHIILNSFFIIIIRKYVPVYHTYIVEGL